MDLQPVCEAYSSVSERYIDLIDSVWQDEGDMDLIRRHLSGLAGTVLDLGCGPGHWTAYLHALGADVTGVDMVPEFIAHARANHPGREFRLGSMTELDVPEHSVAGILSWYSTIHVPPPELDSVLSGFRRLLAPSGVLVIGFFDSDDEVAAFDHKHHSLPLASRRRRRAPGEGRVHRAGASAATGPGTTGSKARCHRRTRVLIMVGQHRR